MPSGPPNQCSVAVAPTSPPWAAPGKKVIAVMRPKSCWPKCRSWNLQILTAPASSLDPCYSQLPANIPAFLHNLIFCYLSKEAMKPRLKGVRVLSYLKKPGSFLTLVPATVPV